MGKYNFDLDAAEGSKARGTGLRVHFKHTREIMHTIKGMPLAEAKKFLGDVLVKKQAVPFTMFTGGPGRKAQLKQRNTPGSKGRWPIKATKVIQDLLVNAEANAEMKGIDVDDLSIVHTQANRAPTTRRRTYRAHGRINPYMSSPAHVELILSQKAEPVKKASEPKEKKGKQQRLKNGASA